MRRSETCPLDSSANSNDQLGQLRITRDAIERCRGPIQESQQTLGESERSQGFLMSWAMRRANSCHAADSVPGGTSVRNRPDEDVPVFARRGPSESTVTAEVQHASGGDRSRSPGKHSHAQDLVLASGSARCAPHPRREAFERVRVRTAGANILETALFTRRMPPRRERNHPSGIVFQNSFMSWRRPLEFLHRLLEIRVKLTI